MIRWARRCIAPCGLAAALALALPAQAERLWLLIGASDTSADALARRAKPLAAQRPDSLVVQTHDCGEPRNVFAWVAEIARSAEAARSALVPLRALAPDAYVKRCDVRPATLLALRIPAVDPSIADVPADAVNWREADRVSALQPLGQGLSLLVTRHFDATPNDALEGRRERVSLVDPSGRRTVLQSHCLDAGRASLRDGVLLLQCTREQAADHLLHAVLAFDASGKQLADIAACRQPRWAAPSAAGPVIACDRESVDADGRLRLQRQLTPLAR